MTKMTHRTKITIDVKVVDLDISPSIVVTIWFLR